MHLEGMWPVAAALDVVEHDDEAIYLIDIQIADGVGKRELG